MRKHLTAFFLLCTATLFANDSSETEFHNPALVNLEGDPSNIVNGSVNVVTGDYVETDVDLVLAGPEALSIERSHVSSDPYNGTLREGWYLNHQGKVELHKGHAFVTDHFGSKTKMKSEGKKDSVRTYGIDKSSWRSWMTNCSSGEISGRTNPNNRKLINNGTTPILIKGNGDAHVYQHRKDSDFFLYYIQRANGNRIFYEFDDKKRISRVVATNKQNQPFSHVYFVYPSEKDFKKNPCILMVASDGRQIRYGFENKSYPQLEEVKRTNAPLVRYSYNKTGRVKKKSLPDNRAVITEYHDIGDKYVDGIKIKKIKEGGDPRIHRVKLQKAPVGTGPHFIVTHRYIYDINKKYKDEKLSSKVLDGTTTVLDARMNKTVYHHNKRHRLTKIEKFDKGQLYSTEEIGWGDQENKTAINLMNRSFKDANGKMLFCRAYTYDSYGNVVQDYLRGYLTGKNILGPWEEYTKKFAYSQDGKNWLLEEDDGRKIIKYDYYPANNQVKKKLIIADGKILHRTFYNYDQNATLIQEVSDDGSGEEISDLTEVTERHIKKVQPAKIGLPHIIEEKYLDLSSGQEVLLKKLVNSYTPQGWLTKQEHYDSNGEYRFSITRSYNSLGKVVKETDPLGHETIRNYDSNANCLNELSPRKDLYKKMTYDYSDRLIREELIFSDGTNLSTHHKYDLCSNRIETVDPNGHATRYEYDAFGRCIKIIQPEVQDEDGQPVRPIRSAEFDLMNRPALIVDARGGETRCSYTSRGQPIEKIYPDGSCETYEYTLDGLLAKSVAKNGMITQYDYDAFGREILKEEYSPAGELLGRHQTIYNTFHKIAEIDIEGNVTHYDYDGAGRLIRLTKGKKETEYRYDSLGRTSHTIEWTDENDALVKVQEYDLSDRVIEERTEDLAGNIYRQTRYGYDAAGNKTHVWNDGKLTVTEYNPLGEVVQTTDADGNTTHTHIEYDFLNDEGQRVKRVTTTDPLGNSTITQYDTLGREARLLRLNPLAKKTQEREFRYDLAGNRVRTIDHVFSKNKPEKQIVNAWEFDPCQRETKRIEAVGTPEQKVIRTTYNAFGQKESVIKPDGVELLYSYDAKGRLETIRSSDDTVHYRYTYDLYDNPVEIYDEIHQTINTKTYDGEQIVREQLGNGLSVEYTYDRLDRPTEIHYPDGSGVRYKYSGPDIAQITRLINGEETYHHTYNTYDLSGNLLQSTLIGQAGTLNYDYDTQGRISSVHHPAWSEEEISYDKAGNLISSNHDGVSRQYDYDDLYQLLSECGLVDHKYEYDSLHNRTSKDGKENAVNSLNQLIDDCYSKYHYDANGNLLNFRDTTLSYDALDRLTKVITPDGEYHYQYDDAHRRITKSGPSQTSHYLYLGKNEIGSSDTSGNLQELRILGHGLGAEIGAAVAIEIQGKQYAPLHDHIGNLTCLLTPETGQIEAKYHYSAYGEENLEGDEIAWRFSSKRVDPETNLVYFGRRYYATSLGRWITQDPAGFSAGINLYAYVNNSPLTHFDLYGLKSRSFWKSFCDFAGYAAGEFLKAFGAYTVPIPGAQDVFTAVGSLLTEGSLINYEPTWSRRPAQTEKRGEGEVHDKVRVTFVNGIMNSINDARKRADEVSRAHGGVNVHLTHMQTFGFGLDLIAHFIRYLGGHRESVAELVQNFRDRIDEMGGVNGGGKIYHYAHSEGGMITNLALQQLTPEERKMIHVVTLGSAKIVDMDGLASLDNYVSTRDIVTPIASPIRYVKACMGKINSVRFIASDSINPLADHDFLGDKYMKVIKERGDYFKNKEGSLF